MSSGQDQRDAVVQKLAEGIAAKALGIAWQDTESQARRVAEDSATALWEVVCKANAVQQAPTIHKYHQAVGELIQLIIGDTTDGNSQQS